MSKIILYSTRSCPKCKVLEKGLDKLGVEYEVIDDEEEEVRRGITSAPILEVDGVRMDHPKAYNYIMNRLKQGG